MVQGCFNWINCNICVLSFLEVCVQALLLFMIVMSVEIIKSLRAHGVWENWGETNS